MARFNYKHDLTTGENTSEVPGWLVTYPATCNGHLGDLGFVASSGYGGSGFVHFDRVTGAPYGMPLTKAARARLIAMRAEFGKEVSP